MRFLAEKNIFYRLCALLEDAGHEAAHVDQFSLGAAEDIAASLAVAGVGGDASTPQR